MNRWTERYPSIELPELQTRLRSADDDQHKSAFFELSLHELLLQSDYEVRSHPTVIGSPKTPDFLVTSATGESFYIEAALVTDTPRHEVAAGRRRSRVLDAIDEIESEFYININTAKEFEFDPPIRPLLNSLRRWLDTLEPAGVSAAIAANGFGAAPRLSESHGGCDIEFEAIPESSSSAGRDVRTLGFVNVGQGAIVTPQKAIRNKIVEKARKYGSLDRPYVLAINATGMFANTPAVLQALFGTEQIEAGVQRFGIERVKLTRAADGAWFANSGPQITRVSAAIVFLNLQPWMVAKCEVQLYHHPWATRPYTGSLGRLPSVVLRDRNICFEEGQPLSRILNLPEQWPDDSIADLR